MSRAYVVVGCVLTYEVVPMLAKRALPWLALTHIYRPITLCIATLPKAHSVELWDIFNLHGNFFTLQNILIASTEHNNIIYLVHITAVTDCGCNFPHCSEDSVSVRECPGDDDVANALLLYPGDTGLIWRIITLSLYTQSSMHYYSPLNSDYLLDW